MPILSAILAHTLASAWRPLVTPAPLWNVWWLLLIPLVAAVAIVYKTVKCRTPGQIPLEAARLAGLILLVMAAGAAALTLLVKAVLG